MVRYSLIVLVTVVVYTAYVSGLDFGLSSLMRWFYA
ncbi:MAG: preprotein translocase subunit SecE [Ilumatobacteraceae bacterium]